MSDVKVRTREEAQLQYLQTLREMHPDPEMLAKIDKLEQELHQAVARTERQRHTS